MTPTTADLRQEPESAHDGGGPRVLFFAPRVCWPLDTGAKLRNYHLARETARRGAVTFLSFADEGEGAGARGGGPEDFGGRVVTVPRERGYTPSKILRGALGRTPLPVLNYTTRAMAEALGRTLAREDFDVVQLESIHMAAYLPVIREARSRPSVVCDWHNVESELMRRYSEREPSLPRRLYARRTAGQLAALERRMLREFDAHVTVSERDRAQLLAAEPGARVFVVENGVDTAFYSDEQLARAHGAWLEGRRAAGAKPTDSGEAAKGPDARRERVLFVGSMDYHANVEAVLYFGKEIWPRVREREPRLVFTVVGRTPPPEIRRLAELPGVEVTGTVEDVRPYYAEALAAVIPLRVGGGSRLKILEAMAAGVPVVSTTLGAEGIEVRVGENILLADDAEATRDALSSLNEDEGLHQRLSSGGRALVFAQYDWSSLGARLGKVYGEILAGRRER